MEVMTLRIQNKHKKDLVKAAKREGFTVSQYLRLLIFKALKLDIKELNDGK